MDDELGWRAGTLDRLRALVRRALFAIVGARGEDVIHRAYHRFLRRLGRFGPPEDAATIALLTAIAQRSETIIDVGANVGRYAWFLQRHAKAHAWVIAIEPHPGAAKVLRGALGTIPGSLVLNVAAGERDGHGSLTVPIGAFGAPVSGLAWVQGHDQDGSGTSFQVRLRRLDGLIEEGAMPIKGTVFMKIDVEGGEAAVLRGAKELLRRHRPILYFECQAASLARQGETPEGVWGELGGASYQIFGNRAGRFVPMLKADTEIVNYLAVPDLATVVVEPLDGAAFIAILDSWTARTGNVGKTDD